jgi:TrmH family RNA methyltransferase
MTYGIEDRLSGEGLLCVQNQAGVISSIKHEAVVEARRGIGQIGDGKATSFLVDGINLASQALNSGAPVETFFFLSPVSCHDHTALLSSARAAGVECHRLNKGVFFRLLGLGYETSSQVLAIVRAEPVAPDRIISELKEDTWLLIGEKIQDPRNVGVMIRNADATGVSYAAFTSESASVYSRQSVRSSTGSIFRVPLTVIESEVEFLKALKERNVQLIGTSARATVPYWKADFARPCAILFGNESEGLSEEAKSLCDLSVGIPVCGGASSFNVTVASGIVLCEAARQRVGGGERHAVPGEM